MPYLALFLYSLIISIFFNNNSFSLGVKVCVSSATFFTKWLFPDWLFRSPKSELSIDISRTFAIFTNVSSEGIPFALSI